MDYVVIVVIKKKLKQNIITIIQRNSDKLTNIRLVK
jgi:hypothetical protein